MGIRSLSTSSIKTGVRRNRMWDQNISFGSDFYQIATTTVGAGGASSVEFTNIPQTYTHLQIRGIARCTYAGTSLSAAKIEYNNDTTATNYRGHRLYGTGSAAGSDTEQTSRYGVYAINNNNTASSFAAFAIDILDYANTNKYKTGRAITGGDYNGGGLVFLTSQVWLNTSAITSIKITLSDGNFSQYSSLALYGVKA